MKKYLLNPILYSTYVTFSLITGSAIFKMLTACSSFLDYLLYGFISAVWIGFLVLGWILLINYINEKRDI
jgi:hypothetical protein